MKEEEEEEEVAVNPELEVLRAEEEEDASTADAGSICQSISKGVFVLTPATIIILALRNSLQW